MYPFFRLGKTITKALLASKNGQTLTLDDVGEITFRSSPTDLDNFMEMNNGRVFTLYDLGRNDFAIRSGLGKLLVKNRWGLVVAGSSIRYRNRIFAFQEITMKTKVAGIDDKWIYIEQSMWVKGKPCSSAILRTGITSKGKVLATQTVLEAMGTPNWQKPLEGWVKTWADSDILRPWPPTH